MKKKLLIFLKIIEINREREIKRLKFSKLNAIKQSYLKMIKISNFNTLNCTNNLKTYFIKTSITVAHTQIEYVITLLKKARWLITSINI